MFEVIGRLTNKVYVTGSKEECNRKLIEMFPNVIGEGGRRVSNPSKHVLPEQMVIRRVARVK